MFQIIFSGHLSGKTSIKKLIFDKIPPHFSELNEQVSKEYDNKLYSFGYCKLNIIEFPSSYSFKNNFKDCEQYLNKCNVLIFVCDYNTKTEQMDYFRKNILPIIYKYKKPGGICLLEICLDVIVQAGIRTRIQRFVRTSLFHLSYMDISTSQIYGLFFHF